MKILALITLVILSLGTAGASALAGDTDLKTPEGVQKFFTEIELNGN
jgi:hypothetical protein